MTTESAFTELMRAIATDPAARGLADDAAVIDIAGQQLVITHDMMVEGVHWRSADDPADVAWKLVSVNLSDLAAKGTNPLGVLLGFGLGDDDWDRRFALGLDAALKHYGVALLGGDTVREPGVRHVGMTALGMATHVPVPGRDGARAGDMLFVTGTLGDAMAGFEDASNEVLTAAFLRPHALLSEGQILAPLVHAIMDVSDGLLLDASRMAAASDLAINIDLSTIPLSPEYVALKGNDRQARIAAASWGDDYQLLFAGPEDVEWPVPTTAVGRFAEGAGMLLFDGAEAIELPAKLGFEHR